jgi:hypothetical protein
MSPPDGSYKPSMIIYRFCSPVSPRDAACFPALKPNPYLDGQLQGRGPLIGMNRRPKSLLNRRKLTGQYPYVRWGRHSSFGRELSECTLRHKIRPPSAKPDDAILRSHGQDRKSLGPDASSLRFSAPSQSFIPLSHTILANRSGTSFLHTSFP